MPMCGTSSESLGEETTLALFLVTFTQDLDLDGLMVKDLTI